MNGNGVTRPAGGWLDFGEESLRARIGEEGFEVELERQASGRLTPGCRERVTEKLRGLLGKSRGKGRRQVYCAVGARGVSLRRVKLPAASRDETGKLLRLQIEREFPVAPEELAWGYQTLGNGATSSEAGRRGQELLVAAVKRVVIEEYAELVRECGAQPVMTLGAFARRFLIPGAVGSYALLDIGRTHAELAVVEGGVLKSVRVLRWGGARSGANEGQPAGCAEELSGLAAVVRARWSGQRLYLTGEGARRPEVRSQIEGALGEGGVCEWLDAGKGGSATIAGLEKVWERGESPFVLEMESVRDSESPKVAVWWRWAALCGLAVVGMIVVRYGEGLLMQPRLERRLSEVREYRDRLPAVDGELGFLQYLKTNQAPYMDVLVVLADAAPPGTRIETLSLNRRGELSMRTTLRDPQQVADFRSKLAQSGLFESVALEEQTAAANRQGVNARFAGRWKTLGNTP
ncbi:MAG: hypothetical protein KJ072_28840 [Verrucomicrobia bacterium]|nr:hypothetical protein [Verrucomicrobiota bacterium]